MPRKRDLNKHYSVRDELTGKARDVPLVDVLVSLHATVDKIDSKRWHASIGPISINDPKFFCWTHQRGGGGAIDLVMLLQDFNFTEAREWIIITFALVADVRPEIPQQLLHSPQRSKTSSKNLDHVVNYLVQQRGLLKKVLFPLIDKEVIYADDKKNAVFFLLGKEKSIVGAELRGTGSTPYKGLSKGSKRTHGFFYAGPEDAKYCILCESAIDALSCQILFPGWLSISTSGVWASPPYLPKLLNRGIRVFCGFDNDRAGHFNAEKMIQSHPSVIRMVPTGKDWNSDLH